MFSVRKFSAAALFLDVGSLCFHPLLRCFSNVEVWGGQSMADVLWCCISSLFIVKNEATANQTFAQWINFWWYCPEFHTYNMFAHTDEYVQLIFSPVPVWQTPVFLPVSFLNNRAILPLRLFLMRLHWAVDGSLSSSNRPISNTWLSETVNLLQLFNSSTSFL